MSFQQPFYENGGMGEYRHSAHAVYDIKYHVIWITKYRCKILWGRIGPYTSRAIADPKSAEEPIFAEQQQAAADRQRREVYSAR